MRGFLFFLFVTSYSGLFAQNIILIDSLQKKIKSATPEQKFEILTTIGFDYRYSHPDSTIYYCNQAFELGKSLGLKKDLSKPLSFIGLASAYKGDYKTSIDYHQRAIEIAEQQNDSTQLAFGYNNLGRMFFDQGDLVRGYDNFIRSKAIFEITRDASGLAYVYRSLANLYKSQHDFVNALEMSRKAYDLRIKLGEPRTITSALLELGLVYQSSGNTKEALNSFRKADSVATKINDPVTKVEIRLGMAEILLESGDKEEAFKDAQAVLNTITEKTNQRLFLRAIFVQAKYFFNKKDNVHALTLFQKMIDEAEKSGTPSFQRDASFFVAEIYKRQNNKIQYNEYSNRYKILNEMLQNTDLNRQIDRLQFQLEIEKKERENDVLKANQAKNTALIAKQRFQNVLLVILVISITAIALISWLNNRRRRQVNSRLALQNQHIITQQEEITKQNESLYKNNQTLQDLNQEKNTLMNIVAHDLKSPLNRILSLVNIIELEGGLAPQQKEYVQLMKESTRSGLDLITDLLDVNELEEIKNLPQKDWIDIASLLEQKANSFQEIADTKLIKIETQNKVGERIFTDPTYITRILDNLLSNAIKFSSRQTSILISCTKKESKLILKVKDSGPGFSEYDRQFLFQKFKKLSARPTGGESSNGLGLAIVKTLADRLNGKINLESSAKGSEFIVEIPLS